MVLKTVIPRVNWHIVGYVCVSSYSSKKTGALYVMVLNIVIPRVNCHIADNGY